VLLYIVPVALLSLAVNVPRWFELKMQEFVVPADEGGGANRTLKGIAGTPLRYDQMYVTYYLHWTILLVTGILPLAALAFLNTRIYLRIKEVQKIRTAQTQNRRV